MPKFKSSITNILKNKYSSIIFDLGGVLVNFNTKKMNSLIGEHINFLSPELACKMMLSEPFRKNAQGIISHKKAIEELYEHYSESIVNIFKTIDFCQTLEPLPNALESFSFAKSKFDKVYILSNITEQSFTHLEKTTPFIREADGYMTSFVAKSRKPDVKIYQDLINLYTIDPQSTLFIDDLEINCKTAYDLGIDSIVYDKNLNLMNILQQL